MEKSEVHPLGVSADCDLGGSTLAVGGDEDAIEVIGNLEEKI